MEHSHPTTFEEVSSVLKSHLQIMVQYRAMFLWWLSGTIGVSASQDRSILRISSIARPLIKDTPPLYFQYKYPYWYIYFKILRPGCSASSGGLKL